MRCVAPCGVVRRSGSAGAHPLVPHRASRGRTALSTHCVRRKALWHFGGPVCLWAPIATRADVCVAPLGRRVGWLSVGPQVGGALPRLSRRQDTPGGRRTHHTAIHESNVPTNRRPTDRPTDQPLHLKMHRPMRCRRAAALWHFPLVATALHGTEHARLTSASEQSPTGLSSGVAQFRHALKVRPGHRLWVSASLHRVDV